MDELLADRNVEYAERGEYIVRTGSSPHNISYQTVSESELTRRPVPLAGLSPDDA